jgi:hypothetical protein
MKKVFLLTVFPFCFFLASWSQDISAKDRAVEIAKNDFSKAKFKEKEKYGVLKEKSKVIESTPVVYNNSSDYQGNYVVQGFNYQLEIRKDPQDKWLVTLTMDNSRTVLKDVSITGAYFSARKVNSDGSEELWEGAFINKNDDGQIDFGLGIRLADTMRFQSININKLFFKKVSP